MKYNKNKYLKHSKEEYCKGEKNGKGKEYYSNGKIFFEGEYLNGKRHGKGKLYDSNDLIEFDGEYTDGKMWNGEYKKYSKDNILLLDEIYVNGEKKIY